MVQNSGFISIYPNYLGNPDTPNLVDGTLNMTKDVDSVVPNFTGEKQMFGMDQPQLYQ